MRPWDTEHIRHQANRSPNSRPLGVERAIEAIAPAVVPLVTRALPAVGLAVGGGEDNGGGAVEPNTDVYDEATEAPADETVYQAGLRTAGGVAAHAVTVENVGGRYPYRARCSCGWETPWGYAAEHAAADMGKYHQEEHTASRRHVAFAPNDVKVVTSLNGGLAIGSNAVCYDCKWIGKHGGYGSARGEADIHALAKHGVDDWDASANNIKMQSGEFDRMAREWRTASSRRTAALEDWFDVDGYLWELHHQSGFKAYAEENGDVVDWWVENDGGDVVDSGQVVGASEEELNQAKTLAEDSLGSMSHYSVRMAAAWHIPWQEEYDGGLFCNLTDGGQAVIHPLGSDAALGTFWTGFVNDPSGREVFTTEGYDKVKVSQELSDYVRDHALHEGSTRRTASRKEAKSYPAHALKPGDYVDGKEVFDTRAGWGGYKIVFTDGSEKTVPSAETEVETSDSPHFGSRRTAGSLWDSIVEPRHKVAGWDWDDHLAGYVAEGASAHFACVCGSNIEAPGYSTCHCGRIWNASALQTTPGGPVQIVCREVPNRGAEVVLASKRTASPGLVHWPDGGRVWVHGEPGVIVSGPEYPAEEGHKWVIFDNGGWDDLVPISELRTEGKRAARSPFDLPLRKEGMAKRVGPGAYHEITEYGTFGIENVYGEWFLHTPDYLYSDGKLPKGMADDVYRTKAEALEAVRGMCADPEMFDLQRVAGLNKGCP
ncbi:hypothetical protein SEA_REDWATTLEHOG_9 [Gordonia phage RedWattleHog]|uniref:Uncharacterized protein n=1 Tax=Gordonia phage Stormageddon TaxID=2656541 RepID=A0A649VSE7_9CAUD|nr:hypothetical protein KHQ86_gp009 [Gordonia phage Stormageddon]QGJ94872.1 hypothetical protein SEA_STORMAGEDDON_9 [Gordonia phage Stormageddon]QLF83513.1 hypothetical protein SEA_REDWATTLEHOG_9 [Gordonia phage RedWattleHog]